MWVRKMAAGMAAISRYRSVFFRNHTCCDLPDSLPHPVVIVGLGYGQARRPGFFDAHERQCSTEERHVFGEVDHVVHSLIWIFLLPEIVHYRGHAAQEAYDH